MSRALLPLGIGIEVGAGIGGDYFLTNSTLGVRDRVRVRFVF